MAGNWGSFIGQGGPRQMDFRDSDSDGIDDRDQLAPWQRDLVGQTHSIPVIPYGTESPFRESRPLTPKSNAHNFLGGFVDKLKEIWNRPIIGPTITKDEHERMIRGEDTGPHNWDSRY